MGSGSWDVREESFPGTSDLLVQPMRNRLEEWYHQTGFIV